MPTEEPAVEAVFVHGIRTSSSMWRGQVEHLRARGIRARAIDLPGHGARRGGAFALRDALADIDEAVRDASTRARVLLVGHSMGGMLTLQYAGAEEPPPVAAVVAASCTSLPRRLPLRVYRTLARALDSLPDRGMSLSGRVLDRTLPAETRADFEAGGYALDAQDPTLAALGALTLEDAVPRIDVPLWFVNGAQDQLRLNERLFQRMAPHAELIVVPRTTHLVTAMRPAVFNAVLDLAVATIRAGST